MKIFLAALNGLGNSWLKSEIYNKTMKIYLAGGATGNNAHIWRDNKPQDVMKIFFTGDNSKKDIMKMFLAENHAEQNRVGEELYKDKLCILESFYYMKDWMIPYIENYWDFLLDSGAFTFMTSKKNDAEIDWDNYVERYANFINKHKVENFIELDIDAVVGIKEVERLRKKLEKLTNRKSIPVWHKSRGKEYWFKMIDEYDYVAIGGMVSGGMGYRDKVKELFPWFLKTAKDKNCKVHGLGYTGLDLHKYPFYSVDSTSWLYGNRGGFLYCFNESTGVMTKKQAPEGMRLKGRRVAQHNFIEWVKLQQYAKKRW